MATRKMQSHSEAVDDIISAVKSAGDAGSYMVAVWLLERGELKLRRVTWNFPTADFDRAVELLQADIRRELKLDPPPPLPEATIRIPSAGPEFKTVVEATEGDV